MHHNHTFDSRETQAELWVQLEAQRTLAAAEQLLRLEAQDARRQGNPWGQLLKNEERGAREKWSEGDKLLVDGGRSKRMDI